MQAPYNISVIIPTYNGSHRIGNTLKAVFGQTLKPSEIIVVVDGSTDNSRQVLEPYEKTGQIKTIYQNNSGRAAARNKGVDFAIGNLLIFYDDDMRPTSESIKKHVEFHINNKNAICGGNQLEEYCLMKTEIQKYKADLSRKWISKYNEGLNRLKTSNLFLTAANMSISKQVFQKLGGFNEKLTDAEDYELVARAISVNIPVFFDKSNIAWHDDFINCRNYITRQRQYAKANKMLSDHVPSLFLRKSINVDSLLWYKKVIYYLFGRKIFVEAIDNHKLKKLPKILRYKVYDWTITSLGKIYTRVTI